MKKGEVVMNGIERDIEEEEWKMIGEEGENN